MKSAKISKLTKLFLRPETKTIWDSQPQAQTLTEAHITSHTSNELLKTWFNFIYTIHKSFFLNLKRLPTIELGSGGSQFKSVMPELTTSDVVQIDGIDKILDAQKMDLPNDSVANLTMINVLHHIPQPLEFFKEAQRVLTPGGKIVFTEPYVSLFSYPIYKYIHHELCDMKNNIFKLDQNDPLLCSNQAIPTVLVVKKWEQIKSICPRLEIEKLMFHSSLSYFLSGGVNFTPLLPLFLWKIIFKLDRLVCKILGRFFASFMTVVIFKK